MAYNNEDGNPYRAVRDAFNNIPKNDTRSVHPFVSLSYCPARAHMHRLTRDYYFALALSWFS